MTLKKRVINIWYDSVAAANTKLRKK